MHVFLEGIVADIGPQPGLQLLIVDGEQTSRCFDRGLGDLSMSFSGVADGWLLRQIGKVSRNFSHTHSVSFSIRIKRT